MKKNKFIGSDSSSTLTWLEATIIMIIVALLCALAIPAILKVRGRSIKYEELSQPGRFLVVSEQVVNHKSIVVIEDSVGGAMYLMVHGSTGVAITPLVSP